MSFLSRIIFVILISCCAATGTHAAPYIYSIPENGVGSITGKLMGDIQPVSGAEVVLMDKDKIVDKTLTDEDGSYSFLYVRPGKYDVRATKTGHRTTIIIKVPVSEDIVTKNDFYFPKFNNAHMQANPIVDNYENNCRTYMRQRK